MNKHSDVCTLLANDEDKDILTRRLFDVNMRLMKTSPHYRAIINAVAIYIQTLATTEREGYKKPHGFSGANAGIPFNIIALADGEVMINPAIIAESGEKVIESNCGSLLLPEPIRIKRNASIVFGYYDLYGRYHCKQGFYPTVQHEIDHNNGILITDRRV